MLELIPAATASFTACFTDRWTGLACLSTGLACIAWQAADSLASLEDVDHCWSGDRKVAAFAGKTGRAFKTGGKDAWAKIA